MKEFSGKAALITGAGNGFGAEFAKEAGRRGMKVLVADINEAGARKTQDAVREAGGTAEICIADVSLEAEVERMVQAAMTAFGRIDLLINNAGIALGGSVVDLPARDWEWIIAVNNMSQVHALKRVIPIMLAQGTPCHIVNVASLAGLVTLGNMPAYFATKHFSVALSESVFYDLQATGADIGMSVFCPGYARTDLHHCERHRPGRFAAKEDPYYSSDTYKKIQKRAERVITGGMGLDRIGERVFKAIERGDFYIETDKKAKILIARRAGDILFERKPKLAFLRRVLGEGA
jgi:NAD(P)-dependent dehydrogenase (short-subunit alcohol dehydrogenase family)